MGIVRECVIVTGAFSQDLSGWLFKPDHIYYICGGCIARLLAAR